MGSNVNLPTSLFSFMGFLANATSGKSEPAHPNLLIFHRIIKRFKEKLKGYRDSVLHTIHVETVALMTRTDAGKD